MPFPRSENPQPNSMNPNRATFRATLLGVFLTVSCAFKGSPAALAPLGEALEGGPILAIGGGPTPRTAIREAIARMRERDPEIVSVVVLAYASRSERRGEGSAAMWLEEGADQAVVAPDDASAAASLIAKSNVIWMGGGDQGRLLDDLQRMGLVERVVAAHARGGLVGGTSAGAAVLGSVCIAGSPDPGAYVVGGMEGRAGLGLVPDAIVDQHFRERNREGRLLTAVLDAGGSIGFGISESTAVFFDRGDVDVMGSGVVVVFDAREAELGRPGLAAGEPRSATGVQVRILSPKRDAMEGK